jgi:GntR family transcriptional regulator/MocR family aminotransferase
MFPLHIDGSTTETLQAQIYDQIREAIVRGLLLPGVALPSSREYARELKLSRNTVMLAYEKLAQEGYLRMRPGSGTFIADAAPQEHCGLGSDLSEKFKTERESREPLHPAVLLRADGLRMVQHGPNDHQIDFWYGSTNSLNFPLRELRKLFIENLPRASANISGYGPPEGIVELRRAIARHVSKSRAIPVDPDQVVITAGAQEGLNLIGRLFVQPCVRIAVESPCYLGAAQVFESYGGVLVPLQVDEQGARTDLLQGCGVTLAYVTPSHQFPTGAIMSTMRRLELLGWAEANGAYIIEDDYDSEFRYDGSPHTAVAGLRNNNSVIYIGSFSKSIGSGLRTGYLIVPRQLIEPTRRAKSLANYGHPWIEQIVLAEFINGGGFSRHLRRLRQFYAQTRQTLLQCLKENFGAVEISGSGAGTHIIWTLPAHFPSANNVAAIAAAAGIGVYPIDAVGAHAIGEARYPRALLMGYSLLSSELVRRGVVRLSQALERAGIDPILARHPTGHLQRQHPSLS